MLGKLALTALVIAIVWLLFARGTETRRRERVSRAGPARAPTEVETLVECPACGVCRPAGAPCPCGSGRR